MNRTEYNIADNLPESLNRENLQQVANLIDEKMHELDQMSELVSLYPRIDELSSNLINELAIQFHVDFYDTTMGLDKRRALVKNSIRWHMKKGTKGIVQELVRTVFDSGTVREWFEYGGDAYHFRIDLLSAPQMDLDSINLVAKVVDTVKNVRSWLDGLGYQRNISAAHYYRPVVSHRNKITISPAGLKGATLGAATYYTGGNILHKKIVVSQRLVTSSTISAPQYIVGAITVNRRIVRTMQ